MVIAISHTSARLARRATVSLIRLFDKPAFVVFTAGPPNAPKIYQDAIDLVRGFGIEACPHLLPDRAVYRHASAAGASVLEFEPTGIRHQRIAA